MIVNTTFTARGDVDPRVAELSEVAAVHGLCGLRLTIAVNLAIWYEDRGLVYDFHSGVAAAIVDDNGSEDVFVATRSGVAVNHLLAPVTELEVEQTLDSLFAPADTEDAHAIGGMDFDDNAPCDPLKHFSDLPCVESYVIGYKEAGGTLPPLQDYIDACAALDADIPPTREQRQDEAAHLAHTEAHFRFAKREASDYEDDMADRDFWAHGC